MRPHYDLPSGSRIPNAGPCFTWNVTGITCPPATWTRPHRHSHHSGGTACGDGEGGARHERIAHETDSALPHLWLDRALHSPGHATSRAWLRKGRAGAAAGTSTGGGAAMNNSNIRIGAGLALFCGLVLAMPARADSPTTLRPHPFQPGQAEMLDAEGTHTLRAHPFRPGESQLRGPDGRPALTIRPDPFRPGEWRIERERHE